MGDIYANSYFTLAATNSTNSEGGLFCHRTSLSVWPCRLTANWSCFPPGNIVISDPDYGEPNNQRPLGDRAWAFQKWLLSERLIHFMADQVRWECNCLSTSEIYPSGLDEDDLEDFGKSIKRSILDLYNDNDRRQFNWESIRITYTDKLLTKATHRLIAFSDIARMVHKVLQSSPEEYVAGLWKPALLKELLWRPGRDKVQHRLSGVYLANVLGLGLP